MGIVRVTIKGSSLNINQVNIKNYSMKYETTNITEHNGTKVGAIRLEQTGKRNRYVKCKGIHKGEDGNLYGHWQYVLHKTLKPSSKSTSFLTLIK